ncbi:MAG: hypothetical protein CMM01_17065 [Rhodopirellula sp.]|nr:hypothetical protein [Rhodopirellula sp.]OUX50059.1 MAG: hypothetical protein CBE43_07800 [Rhodopirellula sp. TMED283]
MKSRSNKNRLALNSFSSLARHFQLQSVITLALIFSSSSIGFTGESVIPLLSGFDQERVAATYPPTDGNTLGELAKLLYRLRSVDPTKLQSMATQHEREPGASQAMSVGDAGSLTGTIKSMQLVPIPKKLIEFLEFQQLHVLTVQITDEQAIKVITFPLPEGAQVGDQLEGAGVVLQVKPSSENASPLTSAILCKRLRWLPKSAPITGWKLLRDQGVDISLLADLGTRNRQKLLAEDGDAFYSMMAAAADLEQSKKEVPAPSEMAPVTLLQGSSKLTGQWIQMNLETVLITRISVMEAQRQAELGSDHYYQIDAVGDLGNVVVQIERPAGNSGPPATFNNRYPVSVVTRSLPVFLERQIQQQEGGDAVISELKTKIQMDGFFFRLWSYETDFMAQHGGGDQFGPLMIAAAIRNKQPDSTNHTGVNWIGSASACAVIFGIFGIWAWQRRNGSRDRDVRNRKKEKEAESLRIP